MGGSTNTGVSLPSIPDIGVLETVVAWNLSRVTETIIEPGSDIYDELSNTALGYHGSAADLLDKLTRTLKLPDTVVQEIRRYDGEHISVGDASRKIHRSLEIDALPEERAALLRGKRVELLAFLQEELGASGVNYDDHLFEEGSFVLNGRPLGATKEETFLGYIEKKFGVNRNALVRFGGKRNLESTMTVGEFADALYLINPPKAGDSGGVAQGLVTSGL